jgi:hypothetical protein
VNYTVGTTKIPIIAGSLSAGQASGFTVYNTSGSLSHVRTTGGVTEIGHGIYYANPAFLLPTDVLVVWDDTMNHYSFQLLY